MKENVGSFDRLARAVLGPALFALGGAYALRPRSPRRAPVAPALAMVGGALIAETAITRVCPVNALLGIDTRRRARAPLGRGGAAGALT
ncbi:MAG TPA: DUF2892 domain-containing protein [Polyangiaceae bacterium]|nr:DUF2892 domain-containing protein [Polyangiaceae bacterium]